MSAQLRKYGILGKVEFRPVLVDKIDANSLNPRRVFPERELDSLCRSIVSVGCIVVPLIGFQKGDRVVLLDGERRLLAAKRLGLKEVPMNVIPEPLSDPANIRAMFTIHREREEWNPVARAKSLAQLREMEPDLTPDELVKMSGMTESRIREAEYILSFPADLQDRALNQHVRDYGIRPAYLVEIGRALESAQKTFPGIIEHYGREKIIRRLIAKIDNRTIRNATNFRRLTEVMEFANEKQALEIFDRLVNDEQFVPLDVDRIVPQRVGTDQITELRTRCEEFSVFISDLPIRKKTDERIRRKAKQLLLSLSHKIERKINQL
jgi:ParB/RepB/Spo0J family partition protein